jgi:hypothetical protein
MCPREKTSPQILALYVIWLDSCYRSAERRVGTVMAGQSSHKFNSTQRDDHLHQRNRTYLDVGIVDILDFIWLGTQKSETMSWCDMHG